MVVVELDCRVVTSPKFLTKFWNTHIFRVEVETKRLSGAVDRFYLNYSSEIGVVLNEGDYLHVTGDLRTLNHKDKDIALEDFVYAKSIEVLESEPEVYTNKCTVDRCRVKRFLEYRKSYGSENRNVADYEVMFDRGHGRMSYIRVTSWDKSAVAIGNVRDTVKDISFEARLQGHVSNSGKLFLYLVTYKLEILSQKEE